MIGGFPGGSEVSSERGSTYNIIFQFVSGKIVFSQVPKSIFEHPGWLSPTDEEGQALSDAMSQPEKQEF